jgi:hypothetical protein
MIVTILFAVHTVRFAKTRVFRPYKDIKTQIDICQQFYSTSFTLSVTIATVQAKSYYSFFSRVLGGQSSVVAGLRAALALVYNSNI